jgi:hypothetical protein
MNAWIYYYAGDFTTLGASRVYTASARNASGHSPTPISTTIGYAAGSRWIRIQFINETSLSDTVAGNVYFDAIELNAS